ncbi:hypothetical protein K8R43_03995 [archaeon]|nr:hypothetical protein [archaeon]
MLARHKTIPLTFALILLVSLFWPVGVMAQNNANMTFNETTPPITEPFDINARLCSLGGINVTNLNYDQALAIQGIVQQDVATSAQRYREAQVVEELGLNASVQTESQKRLEKYNLYFHGPDGMVFYAPKLGQKLRPDNAIIIGTKIDGRVEYGAMMAEDLAMCPELPINDTDDGVCTKRVGEATDDFNIKPGGYTTGIINGTFETVGTSWISLINTLNMEEGVDGSWGYVALDYSRMKAGKWSTSMAVFPSSGSVFIIPRTYMYFTARMKRLAWFDGATQGVFMAHAFGTIMKPAISGLFKRDTLWLKTTSRSHDDVRRLFLSETTEMTYTAKNLNKMDEALTGMMKADFTKRGVRSSIVEKLKSFIGTHDDALRHVNNKASRELDTALVRGVKKSDYAEIVKHVKGKSISPSAYTIKKTLNIKKSHTVKEVGNNLIGTGFSKESVLKVLPSYADDTLLNTRAGITADDVFTRLAIVSTDDIVANTDDLSALATHLDNFDQFSFKGETTKFIAKDGDKYKFFHKAKSNELLETIKPLDRYRKDLMIQRGLLSDAQIAAAAGGSIGDVSYAAKIGELKNMRIPSAGALSNDEIYHIVKKGYEIKPLEKYSKGQKSFATQRRILSMDWLGHGGLSGKVSALKISNPAIAGLARLPLKSLAAVLQGLYFAARPITLVAYGLHLGGLMFEKEGFLTLASPGITLHWDPESTDTLFTPTSSLILLGIPKEVDALHESGVGGYFVGKHVRDFLVAIGGYEPTMATKYSELGQNLLFGGIMYDNTPQIISMYDKENPRGSTEVELTDKGYLMRITNWENHDMVLIEDPASMRILAEDTAVSALGMRTTNMDIYKHSFGQPNEVRSVFPWTWGISTALRKLGSRTETIALGSLIYLWPSIPIARYSLAPVIAGIVGRGVFGGGEELLTSQTTSMKDLEQCYVQPNYTSEFIDCTSRPPCEAVHAKCEASIGMMSMYLGASGIVQMAAEKSVAFSALNLALGISDFVVLSGVGEWKGKIELTTDCMEELLTCNERSFMIIGGSDYRDPSVIQAEIEESQQIKGLPGLDALPIDNFLEGLNIGQDDSLLKPAQMQLNIHSEMDNATGRMMFEDIYYFHLKDAVIDWLRSDLDLHFCPMIGGNPQDELCVRVSGDTIYVGDKPILTHELVPFKWLDENLPALIIPNTAIKININETTDCAIFTSDPSGKNIKFNQDIISTFEGEHFEELERMMGALRDIETDSGAIYPNIDYNGDYRWERDVPDGSYAYSLNPIAVTAKAKVEFENETFGFRSAIFEGGVVIKKGDFIYIVPKYFRPAISGTEWYELTKGKPLVSDTGLPLEIYDDQGQIMGINGSLTRIPGGDKLGTITKVFGLDDQNQTVGFAFTKDENGTMHLELMHGNQTEVFDIDQIEIDEDSGCILVYEKGKPHVEANLIRRVCLESKPDGSTVINITNPQTGETLGEAIVDWIIGTGGSIKYDRDNNNYVFVNGQPIQMNNEFKTHGFDAITGRPEPPLLQPSAIDEGIPPWKPPTPTGIQIPTRPEETDWTFLLYILALAGGIFLARTRLKKRTTP